MDYEEMSEPNMKLSRALLIVLVLHVVAISGMVAFNVIKSRQGELPSVATAKTVAPASTQKSPVPAVADSDSSKPRDETKAPIKEKRKAIPVKSTVETTPKPDPAKKSYVVAKGDSPASIARKFKVPYDDIMEANRIEDPHKLKIGQKLIIPKSTKPKKGDQ